MSGGKSSKKSAKSQRTQEHRGREVDDVRKKSLEDGSLTARADLDVGDTSKVKGHLEDERYDVVVYIGTMLNPGRALAKANPEDREFSTDEEVAQIKVGDGVRICDGVERFWTRVYATEDDLLMAQVGSQLTSGRWALGERVCFLKKDEYAVELSG